MNIQTSTNSRTPAKALMMWIRRGHLYFGLFLFPWAVLYGITAFLFNHPSFFTDSTTTVKEFDRRTMGTAVDQTPTAQTIAEEVVAKLNNTQKPSTPYLLAGPVAFASRDGRALAFGTAKQPSQNISLLIDINSGIGTIRANPIKEKEPKETPPPAPFAVGKPQNRERNNEPRGMRRERGEQSGPLSDGIKLDKPVEAIIKQVFAAALKQNDFADADVSVTSIPELLFPISVDGQVWQARYNLMTGSVQGNIANGKAPSELGWRRFLLRLHTAHGYPSETNSHWFWAVIVDLMAFTMCFWGFSGLLMWWQIKATRKLGAVILTLSAIAATVLGVMMHNAMA
jgi:hypothetical protein